MKSTMSNENYVTERLSIADNMMAPRRYMRVALCLPLTDPMTPSDISQQLELAVQRTAVKYPFLFGSLRVDPFHHRENSLLVDIPKDPLCVTRDIAMMSLENEDNSIEFKSLAKQGFPPSQVAHIIARDSYDPVNLREGCPVFGVQVAFVKHGIILSVYLHHAVADASMFSDVIESVVSNLDPKRVSANPTTSFHLHLDEFESTLQTGDPQDLIKLCPDRMFRAEMERNTVSLRPPSDTLPSIRCTIFQYDLASLLGIRKEILNAMTNIPDVGCLASVNDCIGAYVWAHIIRARLARKDQTTRPKNSRLFVPVDFRHRVRPRVPRNYFGNAIITVPVTMSVATLIIACSAFSNYKGKRALAKVAMAIRQVSDAVDEEYIRRRLSLGKSLPDMRLVRLNFNATASIDVVFNNLAALDAGLTKSSFSAMRDGMIAIRPLATDIPANVCTMLPRLDGVAELVLGLYEDDMEELLGTQSWMRLVSSVIE